MTRMKKEGKCLYRKVAAFAMAVSTALMMTVFSFAATSDAAVTTEMLEPVLEGAKDNLAVIVPIGIGLFVIMLGIGFIPMIFKKFRRG